MSIHCFFQEEGQQNSIISHLLQVWRLLQGITFGQLPKALPPPWATALPSLIPTPQIAIHQAVVAYASQGRLSPL